MVPAGAGDIGIEPEAGGATPRRGALAAGADAPNVPLGTAPPVTDVDEDVARGDVPTPEVMGTPTSAPLPVADDVAATRPSAAGPGPEKAACAAATPDRAAPSCGANGA
jgi:hypothetical protein